MKPDSIIVRITLMDTALEGKDAMLSSPAKKEKESVGYQH
jgi:hypothetical protein